MAEPVISTTESRNPLLGIAMILLAVFFFAGMDAITKFLSQTYSVPMVLAMRYCVSTALMLMVLLPRHGRKLVTWHRPRIVSARAVTMVISSLLAAHAVKRMPVAETVAIIYLAPFGVLLLSGPVLGEKVRAASWIAAIGGFAGLILIARPGGGLDPAGVTFAVTAAVGATWYFLFTRLLASTEDTLALLFVVNITGAVVFSLSLPWTIGGPVPDLFNLSIILMSGVISLVGHYLLTAAHREATAALLAPLNYVHLVWAGLLGWLVFDHIPEPLAILGIALIGVSGGALTVWTQIAGRRKMRPPTS